MILATGGYIGFVPKAPGTAGSLVAFPIICFLAQKNFAAAAGLCLGIIALAVWAAGAAERQLAAKDPGCIVIDEIAGMTVALLGVPLSIGTGAAGFLLFRCFDILKPPPIRLLERRLTGGWGIVMDDVAAGIIVNIVLRIGIHLIP